MAEIEIMEEIALPLPEVSEVLGNMKKRDKELSAKGAKVIDYIAKINNLKEKEAKEMEKKLNSAGISRLKQKNIAKIIDINPKDIDSLRAILVGDNLTLKQEDLQKILECLK
jgi:DNA-directed RNA polymerase subunit F